MNSPTIDELFSGACEQLDAVYRQLSDTRDLLNSDWSDGRHLTEVEGERRAMMQREISDAKRAIERAKDPVWQHKKKR